MPDRRIRRLVWWVAPPIVLVILALAGLRLLHVYQTGGVFHVGTCFQRDENTGVVAADGLREVTGRAKVVSCSDSHDGEITRAVNRSSDCAHEGAWLYSRSQTYCVVLTG